jgi:hypothetical protein
MKTKISLFFLALFLLNSVCKAERTWEYVDAFRNKNLDLRKIWAQGTDTIFIIGGYDFFSASDGFVVKSIDRGNTWVEQKMPQDGHLNDIVFCNPTIGFIVGESGLIFKTVDSGATWIQKTTNIEENLSSISFVDSDNLWAAGNNGCLIHSADAGETWQTVDLGSVDQWNDIAFLGNEGYLIGNSSFYKTENGGASWTQAGTWGGTSLCLTPNHIYVLDGRPAKVNGNLLSWHNATLEFTSFAYIDDTIGYGVFTGIMTNGGQNAFEICSTEYTSSNDDWNFQYGYFPWDTYVNIDHSDIFFPNDSIGYAISGQILMRTPSSTGISTPSYPSSISETAYNKKPISFDNKGDILIIKSTDTFIQRVELFNISGISLFHQKQEKKRMETEINTFSLQQGIYLIKVIFTDNSTETVKWLKY